MRKSDKFGAVVLVLFTSSWLLAHGTNHGPTDSGEKVFLEVEPAVLGKEKRLALGVHFFLSQRMNLGYHGCTSLGDPERIVSNDLYADYKLAYDLKARLGLTHLGAEEDFYGIMTGLEWERNFNRFTSLMSLDLVPRSGYKYKGELIFWLSHKVGIKGGYGGFRYPSSDHHSRHRGFAFGVAARF